MIKYRPDIDGLRALAVISVIIFHINNKWLPGGFIGVDIFFVISGFLITNIISKELQNSTFSFKSFYIRRIKRIIPAYIFLILSVLITGIILLLPEDLNILAKSAFSSIFAMPNIYFWKNLNIEYFADSSKLQPLLHLWSLGVEEQFYLCWPITLFCFYKVIKENYLQLTTVLSIMLITILSFCIAQKLLFIKPQFVYYMLPTRIGELLIGAVVSQTTNYKLQTTIHRIVVELLSFLGIGLVIFALYYLNEERGFPGVNALYPCMGAALLIYTGQKNTIVSRILSIKIFVGTGLISYSLYLWHWPVIAFMTYIFADLDTIHVIYIIFITIIFSTISYIFIENPFRNSAIKHQKLQITVLSLSIIFAILLSLYYIKKENCSDSLDRIISKSSIPVANGNAPGICLFDNYDSYYNTLSNNIKRCISGNVKHVNTILLGDSNALHFLPYLQIIANKYNWGFISTTLASAVIFDQAYLPHRLLAKGYKKAIASIISRSKKFDIAIIGHIWHRKDYQLSQDHFSYNLELLSKRFKIVIILLTIPSFSKYDRKCFRKKIKMSFINCDKSHIHSREEIEFNNYIISEIKKYNNVFTIDIANLICHNKCKPSLDNDLIYYDKDHLSYAGSKKLGEYSIKFNKVPKILLSQKFLKLAQKNNSNWQ